jgi:hypothetical protein
MIYDSADTGVTQVLYLLRDEQLEVTLAVFMEVTVVVEVQEIMSLIIYNVQRFGREFYFCLQDNINMNAVIISRGLRKVCLYRDTHMRRKRQTAPKQTVKAHVMNVVFWDVAPSGSCKN